MKSATTVILAILLALGTTTVATAAPILTGTITDIGSGLAALDLFFDGNDGVNASAGIDLKIEGNTINQVSTSVGSLTTTTLTNLESFAALGPDPVFDSYFYQGNAPTFGLSGVWDLNLPTGIDNPNGAAGGSASSGVTGDPMWISAGTPGGVAINTAQIAHVVFTCVDGYLDITGRIARGGQAFDVDITVCIPEPSSIILLGMGTVALAGIGWRRRRKRQT